MDISTDQLKDLLSKVKTISIDAGQAILDVYESADFNVEIKGDDSPLTRADKESNEVICRGLENLDPLFPIISEENKNIPYDDRKDFEYFWLVDPLDGTKEFIKRNGEFTVNIALVHGQTPVLGAVYVPVSGEFYWGIRGLGAGMDKNGQSDPISVADFKMTDQGLRVVCSRSHLNDETQRFVDDLSAPETVSKGSSLKFLVVAEGSAHLYPRIAPTMEWDTCAAQCVLEAAGGSVMEYGKDTPLVYNKENLLNPYFLAAGKVTG